MTDPKLKEALDQLHGQLATEARQSLIAIEEAVKSLYNAMNIYNGSLSCKELRLETVGDFYDWDESIRQDIGMVREQLKKYEIKEENKP